MIALGATSTNGVGDADWLEGIRGSGVGVDDDVDAPTTVTLFAPP
jgi:hypothetical protein